MCVYVCVCVVNGEESAWCRGVSCERAETSDARRCAHRETRGRNSLSVFWLLIHSRLALLLLTGARAAARPGAIRSHIGYGLFGDEGSLLLRSLGAEIPSLPGCFELSARSMGFEWTASHLFGLPWLVVRILLVSPLRRQPVQVPVIPPYHNVKT
jgi:hypothetical protein